MTVRAIDVAVAVVRDPAGQVLLAERTARQVAAGFWELPGGKIEPGEAPIDAAARELLEETGLIAGALQPLMSYDHAFPTKRVRLHIFHAANWQGTPSGREGQRLAWTDPAAPGVAPVLPSNDRVLTALGLPPRMVILDLAAAGALSRAQAALSAGARLLHLRGDRLAPDQRVAIARRICDMARGFGAGVLLAGSVQDAARAGATGLHSNATALRGLMARPPVRLWSVSCHDAADRRRAAELGADLMLMAADRGGADHGVAIRLSAPGSVPLYAADGCDPVTHAAQAGSARIAADAVPAPRAWMMSRGAAARTGNPWH